MAALVALLSDIHSNHPALEAVLEDMQAYRPGHVYNLGDTVGYGPHPDECIDWAREKAEVSLLGNHDAACAGLLELDWFNPWAREAIEWTTSRLSTDRRLWLQARPHTHWMVVGGLRVLLAHGTPQHPVTEYVDGQAARRILGQEDPPFDVCLVGHTHLIGVYAQGTYHPLVENTEWDLLPPCLVNIGSVGQPRDGRPEAGYVLLDGERRRLIVRRVPYRVEDTKRAILAVGLPESLAHRLSAGR